MKKKLLAIILSVAMVVALMPTLMVFATTSVQFGTKYSDSIGEKETKEYTIQLNSSGKLNIDVQTYVDSYVKVILKDWKNDEIDSDIVFNSDRDASNSYDLAMGTYVLIFEPGPFSSGNYNFTANFTSANETYTYDNNFISDIVSKEAVPFNTKIYGQFAKNDATDIFKINLPSSGKLKLDIQTYIEYSQLYLYDSDGKELGVKSFLDSTRDYTEYFDLIAGTYYVKFDSSHTGNYNFMATFTSANETYSYENNFISDIESKEAIPFNTKINGQIAINDNSDIYKIKMPTTGTLKLKIQTFVDYMLAMKIYDKNGKEIEFEYFNENTRDYTKSYKLSSGTYYVEFSESGETGNYNFTASIALSGVKSVSLKAGKKSFTVKAKKNGSVNGYEVRYSTDAKTWKTSTITTTGDLSKKVSKLKSKKKYYVQVRKFKKYDDVKAYSSWSSKKSIKTK